MTIDNLRPQHDYDSQRVKDVSPRGSDTVSLDSPKGLVTTAYMFSDIPLMEWVWLCDC